MGTHPILWNVSSLLPLYVIIITKFSTLNATTTLFLHYSWMTQHDIFFSAHCQVHPMLSSKCNFAATNHILSWAEFPSSQPKFMQRTNIFNCRKSIPTSLLSLWFYFIHQTQYWFRFGITYTHHPTGHSSLFLDKPLLFPKFTHRGCLQWADPAPDKLQLKWNTSPQWALQSIYVLPWKLRYHRGNSLLIGQTIASYNPLQIKSLRPIWCLAQQKKA